MQYLGVKGDVLPSQITIDEYLASIDPKQINELLMTFFLACQKNKLFYHHAETLLPGNSFHLGVDGFWIHHYQHPHAHDKEGNNTCPYCLSRTHNKGSAEEYKTWVHVFVTFVMLFPGGMTLPVYLYPLKAEQVKVSANNDDLKQECELLAAHIVLPKIRAQLPKTTITFLGDSLYANQPFIKLCEDLSLHYIIVRKEKSLPKVGKQCDELARTEIYKDYCKQQTMLKKTGRVVQAYQWFNNVSIGSDTYTNVLRFSETISEEGKESSTYENEWLCSQRINATNGYSLAARGRLRWDHEDFHNTLKNRGFGAKHDYARANPILCVIWKFLMVLAFAVFELFSFTQLAITAKGRRSWKKFATSLLAQLVSRLWEHISASQSLQKHKIQFRYLFNSC